MLRVLGALLFVARIVSATAQVPSPSPKSSEPSTSGISHEVKDVFDHAAKAVVKIRASDQHGDLAGTGFFIDPTGTLYTAYSVGGEAENITVEYKGKKLPARTVLADLRSGIAILKAEIATPSLPIGKSSGVEVATPVVTIGFPLDLPETPSFGMVAGFDKKFLGGYFTTTHMRVNLATQRGEAGAPLLNFKGEVVGILVSSVDNNGSACYALPIDAAEKIRNDFVRFGEARHGWIGINVAEATKPVAGSSAEMTQIMEDTPAAGSGVKAGDILLQVGQKAVHDPEDVIDASFFITAGENVPIVVVRDGKKMTFNVQADLHPMTKLNPTPLRYNMLAAPPPHRDSAIPLRLDSPASRTP